MLKQSCLKIACATAIAFSLAACDEQDSGKSSQTAAAQPQATQVGTVTVHEKSITLTEDMPGRTVAFRQADVRPQVDGIIKQRNFDEGAFVKAGQQLYQIDQNVYLAEVDAAKATLDKQKATLDQAVKNRKRYEKLVKTRAVSEQTYDDAISTEAQAKADVEAAKAELEKARINLQYTTVTAPISGKIGASNFTEGALVTAAQTSALATITQLDPIYVDVTQAGGRLMRVRQAIKDGRLKGEANGKIPVSLIVDSTGQKYQHDGTLQFSDVNVDETTGTVRLRAVFPNPDGQLYPGMFVHGEVVQGILDNGFFVPQKAVMRRTDGTAYVYVAKDGKVESKEIAIDQSQGKNWIVSSGLADGDQVIVTGLQSIGPGSPVAAKPVDDSQANDKAAE